MVEAQVPQTSSSSMTGLVVGGLITFAAVTTVGATPTDQARPPILSEQLRQWETTPVLSGDTRVIGTEQWKAVLTQFAAHLIEDTIEPVPEFDAVISEHFWDLA